MEVFRWVLLLVTVLHERTFVCGQSFDKTTQGESGEVCTEKGEKCLSYAKCENGRCVCPLGWKGDGRIECVLEDDHLCTVIPDYRVRAFGGDKTDLRYPCTNRLAAFTVDSTVNGLACVVDVMGIPQTFRKQTRVLGFFVVIAIYDTKKPENYKAAATLKVGVSQKGFYNFETNTDMDVNDRGNGWGKGAHLKWKGVKVLCVFDEVNNFAVLSIPKCSTTIKYRPFKASDVVKRRQPDQVPGITIQAPRRAKWNVLLESKTGLCGTPEDKAGLWRDVKDKLAVTSQIEATLYTVLAQPVSQLAFVYRGCMRPGRSFLECRKKRRNNALKLCSRIFSTKSRYFECMVSNGCDTDSLLLMFDHCIRYACTRDSRNCRVVQDKQELAPKCKKFAGSNLRNLRC